jgi:multidrug efflux system membrane fusion protein
MSFDLLLKLIGLEISLVGMVMTSGFWKHQTSRVFFNFLLGVLTLLIACSSGSKEAQGPAKSVPVMVAEVSQKSVPVQLRAIGNVQAYSTVSIKTLVAGQLIRVHFKEGQDVKKGDLLFTIDPRPFEAALTQAEANVIRDLAQVKQAQSNLAKNMALLKQAEATLEKDMAQAKNAEADAERYRSLIDRKVVSEQQYDQFRTNAEALEATVRADKAAIDSANASIRASKDAVENAQAVVRADRAAIENAKIQLGYCFIRSPIDGRTGNLLLQEGNIVKANDTPYLVVINQINPIFVVFSIPEQNLPLVKKYMAAGKLAVEAIIPDDEKGPEQGVLSFVDNTVDAATGTIQLKGTFANTDRRLWPGQFVNVVLTLTIEPGAIVIPSQAVQTSQQGHYVFVVKSDLSVESRPVVVQRILNEETVVEQGLKPGETVVTDGHFQLVPGSKVEMKNRPSAATSLGKPQ